MRANQIKIVFIFILAAFAAIIWYAVFYFESRQNLIITFFDVGQGDSAFLEVPNGNQVLIDGGPGNAVLAKLGSTLPFWDRSIDLVIVTHPHADHLDGLLEVLKRYKVGIVLETGVNHSLPEYAEWRELLKNKDVKVVIAQRGQRVELSGSAYLDILAPFKNFAEQSPKNIHDSMVVAELFYGSVVALFMGDAERFLEYQLVSERKKLKADILKTGHHGSKTSSAEEFLKTVSPKFAVISAGAKNRYGHPHQEVLDRLKRLGIAILRTDEKGDINFTSDGFSFRYYP